MNIIKSFATAIIILASAIALNAKTPGIGDVAPDFTLVDTYGNEHSLSDFEGKYVILEWINVGCPFVKKHYGAKNMQKLQEKYTNEGVIWLLICSSAEGKQGYMDNDQINKILMKWEGKQTAYLRDESGKVGKAYGARTTPDMRIITPDGKIAYIGAIDSVPSTDQDDIPDAINYVDKAMQALMNGNEVDPKVTQPYGCSVKY